MRRVQKTRKNGDVIRSERNDDGWMDRKKGKDRVNSNQRQDGEEEIL